MSEQLTLNDDEVMIPLDGRDVVLKMTLKAITTLSRMHGGITGVTNAVIANNLDVMCHVIQLGLNLSDREAKGLEAKVYRTGTVNLVVPLVRYVTGLANGGKVVEVGEDDGAADTGNA